MVGVENGSGMGRVWSGRLGPNCPIWLEMVCLRLF